MSLDLICAAALCPSDLQKAIVSPRNVANSSAEVIASASWPGQANGPLPHPHKRDLGVFISTVSSGAALEPAPVPCAPAGEPQRLSTDL